MVGNLVLDNELDKVLDESNENTNIDVPTEFINDGDSAFDIDALDTLNTSNLIVEDIAVDLVESLLTTTDNGQVTDTDTHVFSPKPKIPKNKKKINIDYTLKELREIAKTLDISVSGKKSELVNRIYDVL